MTYESHVIACSCFRHVRCGFHTSNNSHVSDYGLRAKNRCLQEMRGASVILQQLRSQSCIDVLRSQSARSTLAQRPFPV